MSQKKGMSQICGLQVYQKTKLSWQESHFNEKVIEYKK